MAIRYATTHHPSLQLFQSPVAYKNITLSQRMFNRTPTLVMVSRKSIVLFFCLTSCLAQESYHYSRFSGPVSGPVEEISVPRSHNPNRYNPNDMTFDYIAKPDYAFVYGVNDPETGNSQKREETREGDIVRGEYSVLEPDGSIRRVVYTADPEHGFQATVHRTPPPEQAPSYTYNDDYYY